MRVIYKTIWPVATLGTCRISLPKGAQILSFQNQHDTPTFWFSCEKDEKDREDRLFGLYGTGHLIETENVTFIGTAQFGSLIFHLLEIHERTAQ